MIRVATLSKSSLTKPDAKFKNDRTIPTLTIRANRYGGTYPNFR